MQGGRQSRNIAAIVCYSSPSDYIIAFLQPHRTQILSEYLRIDRKTAQITVVKSIDKELYKQRPFSAFLGVVEIFGEKFLLMCEQSKKASGLQKMEVFEIATLDFLSYQRQEKIKEGANWKQIYEKIRDYYIILKDGFYFSHQYNLTLSLACQSQQVLALNFCWNRRLLQQLDRNGIGYHWKTAVIQGFVGSFDTIFMGVRIKYMLVTRRSTQKGGTRYFDRGVSDEGYVANFCETEQIVKLDEYWFSDLQIRGSLPIFFQQVGLYTKTKVNRGFELSHEAYSKHIQKLIRQYKRVFMVNLLSLGKRGEKMLTQQIESHIKAEQNEQLKYLYYDFHAKVKDNNFEAVDQVIVRLREMKINLGCYVYNMQTDRVLSEQAGVFRTNCLDCLDRTNFFQAKLAIITLQNIFKITNVGEIDMLSEMKNNRENVFIRRFRNIWADNGDAVSWHYTGTGSTHTDITRDGKRGFLGNIKHKYKSIARFYNQNFWDFYKMRVVNLLLGSQKSLSQLNAGNILKQRETEYVNTDNINVYVFTWKAPKVVPFILPPCPTDVDFIVIAVQDLSEPERWFQLIEAAVDGQLFVQVQGQCVSDNLLVVFVRGVLKGRVSSVQQGKIKFSSYYNSWISNKSANFIRLRMDDSKLVFVGCQLQKGREFVENRIRNLKEIHEYAFQQQTVGLQKTSTILFDEAIFLMGNMNTNISASFRNQFGKISLNGGEKQTSLLRQMLATDEFQRIRMSLLEYRVYQEETIKFLPTYRYSNGSFDPDCSGWTDRIWFSSEGRIKCLRYDVVSELRQEHVPVVGRYSVQVKRIDEKQQQRIGSQIVQQQMKEEVQGEQWSQEGDQEEEAINL